MGISEIDSFDQEAEFRKMETEGKLLVGDEEEISVLVEEYTSGSAHVVEQLFNLAEAGFRVFRRCRRDGDCFYRAASFCLIEEAYSWPLEEKEALLERTAALLAGSYETTAFEDFHGLFREMLFSSSLDEILGLLTADPVHGNSLAVLMRFLTSAQLRRKWDTYRLFVEDGDRSAEAFCQRSVEPPGQYADHVMTVALSDALGCSIQIFCLDAATTELGRVETGGGSAALFTLLYRPEHYDILYQRSKD